MPVSDRQSAQRPSQPNGNSATDREPNVRGLSVVVPDATRFDGQHGDEHYEATDIHQRKQQLTEGRATQLHGVFEGVEIIDGKQKIVAAGDGCTASRQMSNGWWSGYQPLYANCYLNLKISLIKIFLEF